MSKPILCLDFDGVIHSYSSGWKGADVIPDPPVPGAFAFIKEAIKHFTVAIYSSRSNQPGGQQAMREWFGYWSVPERASDDEDFSWMGELQWPDAKPSAMVTIDDHALTFNGTWPAIETLKAFQPWNKRSASNPDYTEMSGPDLLEALGNDAQKWAAAFNQTAVKLGYSSMDGGWLIGWFANAMMAQQDFLFPEGKPVRLPDGSGVFIGTIHEEERTT